MARENFVLLHGQIQSKPKIYQSTEGNLARAILAVKVLRRPYLNGNGEVLGGRLHIDCPIIMSGNEELIKKITYMKQGDMVDIRGVLTTREVLKSTICKKCGTKNTVQGNSVYITPIYICQREKQLDTMAGFELLKERNEISNVVLLIGNLCRPPQIYHDSSIKYSSCQYQIATNRKYHIRDNGAADVRTDYPWIKSFGEQADQDAIHLQEGATIYVNGSIQTREVARTTVCEHCGEEYVWKDTASEVVPHSVEYLENCLFPEREQQGEEAVPNEEATR